MSDAGNSERPRQYKSVFRAASIVLALQPLALKSTENKIPDCLFAFPQAGAAAVVQPCGPDGKDVVKNAAIQSVMQRFNITTEEVKFQECPGGAYLAMPDVSNENKYIIQYPKETGDDFVAPITHELAHVFQMRLAGGLQNLRDSNNPRAIELGADFLSGILFRTTLKHLPGNEFENSLSLVGSYDPKKKSHGLPNHRQQAFRLGFIGKYPHDELKLNESWNYFRENDYARIK